VTSTEPGTATGRPWTWPARSPVPGKEARALAGLGRYALAVGDTAAAAANLRQAQEIFQRTGAADAAGIAAELHALIHAGPAAQGP
jgi:hypothetical protein